MAGKKKSKTTQGAFAGKARSILGNGKSPSSMADFLGSGEESKPVAAEPKISKEAKKDTGIRKPANEHSGKVVRVHLEMAPALHEAILLEVVKRKADPDMRKAKRASIRSVVEEALSGFLGIEF